MRLLLIALLATGLCTSVTAQDKVKIKEKDGKMKVKGNTAAASMATLPYKAIYSSNFSIGNPKYASMILDMWKDFDNNNLMNHDYFSDSAIIYLPDGNILKTKQQIGSMMSQYRGSFKSVSSTLDAWVPLHSNDMNTDLVGVWGTETHVMNDGSTNKQDIHEIWAFNKDGKIEWMKQWAAKNVPMN